MSGWGMLFGKIAEQFQSPAQRRRNAIDKLEFRQKFIEKNKRNDLAGEYIVNRAKLTELYTLCKNS